MFGMLVLMVASALTDDASAPGVSTQLPEESVSESAVFKKVA